MALPVPFSLQIDSGYVNNVAKSGLWKHDSELFVPIIFHGICHPSPTPHTVLIRWHMDYWEMLKPCRGRALSSDQNSAQLNVYDSWRIYLKFPSACHQSTWPFVPKQPVRTKLRCHIHNITDKWPNFHVHMMNGMQVQHTHICTLIGPAWFHLFWVATVRLLDSFPFGIVKPVLSHKCTHISPLFCRHAACPAVKGASNLGAATGLQMPASEFLHLRLQGGSEIWDPALRWLHWQPDKRLQARDVWEKIISFQLPVGFLPHLNDFLLIV